MSGSVPISAEEIITNIKVWLKYAERDFAFILTDNIQEDQLVRLDGKMFEDDRARVLVHTKHEKHVRTLLRKYPKSRIETNGSAQWKLPKYEGSIFR